MSRKKRIINGEGVEIEEFPYLVQLHYQSYLGGFGFGCGGTIIGPKYVLSAAHCLLYRRVKIPVESFRIYYGSKFKGPRDDMDFLNLVSYQIHGEYDPLTNQNDISVLKVFRLRNFSKLKIRLVEKI